MRAKGREQRAKGGEQRAKGKEVRGKGQGRIENTIRSGGFKIRTK